MRNTLSLLLATLLAGIAIQLPAQSQHFVQSQWRQKMTTTPQTEVLSCSLDAMTSAERQRHDHLANILRHATKQVKELPNGYAFRYDPSSTVFVDAAEFITLERRCCSFFHFRLEQEPDNGAIWLTVTGPPDAKVFIKAALNR